MSDPVDYNREAWDRKVDDGDVWTRPFSAEVIAEARAGRWSVLLTPTIPVPAAWFPEMRGADVLGLACGGGQQCAVFAALGARVTVFDNSLKQLAQDAAVAKREGFDTRTVLGDMRDLSAIDDDMFDVVFNPVSNCFAPEVVPIWRECARVLRPGGVLLAGFANPVIYTFDPALSEHGVLKCKYPLPYSDVTSLTDDERRRWTDAGEPLCFGHTLQDQIGGQLDAGFALTHMFEDHTRGETIEDATLNRFFASYFATRAVLM